MGSTSVTLRAPQAAGKNLAAETLPRAVAIDPSIVDPRRAHVQRPAAGDELARWRLAVADHLRPSTFIARLAVPLDVFIDLRFERLLQHLQRPALQDLIQRAPQFLVLFRRLLDYSQHGWRLLPRRPNRALC
jgi:hypothetical protein